MVRLLGADIQAQGLDGARVGVVGAGEGSNGRHVRLSFCGSSRASRGLDGDRQAERTPVRSPAAAGATGPEALAKDREATSFLSREEAERPGKKVGVDGCEDRGTIGQIKPGEAARGVIGPPERGG